MAAVSSDGGAGGALLWNGGGEGSNVPLSIGVLPAVWSTAGRPDEAVGWRSLLGRYESVSMDVSEENPSRESVKSARDIPTEEGERLSWEAVEE